jgi:electron transfer flavoprotein beta subunit
MAEPESESDTQFIEGDSGEQASRLGDLLQDMGVVEG